MLVFVKERSFLGKDSQYNIHEFRGILLFFKEQSLIIYAQRYKLLFISNFEILFV